MRELEVVEDPGAAIALLDQTRAQVLAALIEPGSASSVAAALDLPRQRVNYHLRALEAYGLVELVEERPRRGLTERVFRASAATYVVSPGAVGAVAADPRRTDRLSASYLVALAARLVREVAAQSRRAAATGRILPTLAIDTEIRFATPADRAAFTADLAEAMTALASRYHDEAAPAGRWYRLIVAAHPRSAPSGETHEEDV